MSRDAALDPFVDPRDREYAETLPDDARDMVLSTVTRFRRPERLRIGDHLPALEAPRLEDGRPVSLGSLVNERPLVLVFGSFT